MLARERRGAGAGGAPRSCSAPARVRLLDALRGWLVANNAVIMAVLLIVIGALILGDAIAGLSA